jgi:hypothetical protein
MSKKELGSWTKMSEDGGYCKIRLWLECEMNEKIPENTCKNRGADDYHANTSSWREKWGWAAKDESKDGMDRVTTKSLKHFEFLWDIQSPGTDISVYWKRLKSPRDHPCFKEEQWAICCSLGRSSIKTEPPRQK